MFLTRLEHQTRLKEGRIHLAKNAQIGSRYHCSKWPGAVFESSHVNPAYLALKQLSHGAARLWCETPLSEDFA